jgi:hypothetical protein
MMSDDPVCDHCGVGGPTYTAADLEAAFRLALKMAANKMNPIIRIIISRLEPPTDLAKRVEEARVKGGGV